MFQRVKIRLITTIGLLASALLALPLLASAQSISQPSPWKEKFGDQDHPDIRSSQATTALTKKLTTLSPKFLKKRQVTVLYPGSGSHLAVLDIAHTLIADNLIDSANFIFTEIDCTAVDKLQTYLKELEEAKFYSELKVTSRPLADKEPGSETEINFKYHDKPMQILFACNRSGKAYFRPEYLKQADIVYNHDLDSGLNEMLADIMTSIGAWNSEAITTRELYYFGENMFGPSEAIRAIPEAALTPPAYKVPDELKESAQQISSRFLLDLLGTSYAVEFGFGHRGPAESHSEKGAYQYDQGLLLAFDLNRLAQIKPTQAQQCIDFIFLGSATLIVSGKVKEKHYGWASGKELNTILLENPDYLIQLINFTHSSDFDKRFGKSPILKALIIYGRFRFLSLLYPLATGNLSYADVLTGQAEVGASIQSLPVPDDQEFMQFLEIIPYLPLLISKDPRYNNSVRDELFTALSVALAFLEPLNSTGNEVTTMSRLLHSPWQTRIWFKDFLQDGLRNWTSIISDRKILARLPASSREEFVLKLVRFMGRIGYGANDPSLKTALTNVKQLGIFTAENQRLAEQLVNQALQNIAQFEQELEKHQKD
jgi:hypothetical protein